MEYKKEETVCSCCGEKGGHNLCPKFSKYMTTKKIIPPEGVLTITIENTLKDYELHLQCTGDYKKV